MMLTEGVVPASSLMEMAQFRLDDAKVIDREFFKTRKA
jgi:hypothetical protein